MPRPRLIFLAILLACAALLGYGYYLQYGQGLEPCPLCIFQRVCFMVLGAIALLAVLHNPAQIGGRVYAALASLSATAGIVFAGRQVWLQHLPPDKVPACGPGLEYWMQTLPLAETIKKVFRGTGECAEVDWTFLGLSIAEWSLICFVLFLTAALSILLRRKLHSFYL
jgi:disulfide bond formation protein DsbB